MKEKNSVHYKGGWNRKHKFERCWTWYEWRRGEEELEWGQGWVKLKILTGKRNESRVPEILEDSKLSFLIFVHSSLECTIQDSNMLGTDDREGNVEREGKREYMRGENTHSGTKKNVRS